MILCTKGSKCWKYAVQCDRAVCMIQRGGSKCWNMQRIFKFLSSGIRWGGRKRPSVMWRGALSHQTHTLTSQRDTLTSQRCTLTSNSHSHISTGHSHIRLTLSHLNGALSHQTHTCCRHLITERKFVSIFIFIYLCWMDLLSIPFSFHPPCALKNGWDLKKRKTFGFEGDFTKGNALAESRQNSEEVLGVEILSDTTLTRRGVRIFSTQTRQRQRPDYLAFCICICHFLKGFFKV